jgi:hypothetical protein
MAITSIVGFQQYRDYLETQFGEFTDIGNLPFVANNFGQPNRFYFWLVEDRVWLRGQGWYHNTNNYERGTSLYIPFDHVYPDHLTGEYDKFWMGFRYYNQSTVRRPDQLLHLHWTEGVTPYTYFSILSINDIPITGGTFFYYEVKVDLTLGLVKRWRDGVRLDDLAIPSTYSLDRIDKFTWYMGEKQRYKYSYRDLWINDFYFMVDTSQDEDGLPSNRLGQVKVEPLVPETVVLPEDWQVPEGTTPVDLVTDTFTEDNMRNVPVIETSSDATVGEFKFARPDVEEGEVLMIDLEVYGHRDYGDNVELNTQVVMGSQEFDVINHELEPERIKVNERSLNPGHLYTAPDGSTRDEEKLSNLSIKVWSTKLEEG